MSNNSIRTTIDDTIRRFGSVPMGYERVVEAVKVAVEGLAESAAESLRESGRALGASDEQIEAALVSAGLVEPEPEPENVAADPVEERFSKIEAGLARLSELADRYIGRR